MSLDDHILSLKVPDTFSWNPLIAPILELIPEASQRTWARAYGFLLQEKSLEYGISWDAFRGLVYIPDLHYYNELRKNRGNNNLIATLIQIVSSVSMDDLTHLVTYYSADN